MFLLLDPKDWWMNRVGYIVFSGMHTAMVKRGGNVKTETCKLTVVVFLVAE
jgi:hypothetical protein